MPPSLPKLLLTALASTGILCFGCKPIAPSTPVLAANQVFRGVGQAAVEPVTLSPGIVLSFPWNAETGRTNARFSGHSTDGETIMITDGEGIPAGGPYIYYWEDEAKTFWLATPRVLKQVRFPNGIQGTSSWVTSNTPEDPNCPRNFVMPAAFKEANQAMLAAEAGKVSPPPR